MNEAVVAMREDLTSIKNRLQWYMNDFLMYGKYNVKTLDGDRHCKHSTSEADWDSLTRDWKQYLRKFRQW